MVHTTSRDSLGGRETPGEVPNWISGKHAAGEEKKSEAACTPLPTCEIAGKAQKYEQKMKEKGSLIQNLYFRFSFPPSYL